MKPQRGTTCIIVGIQPLGRFGQRPELSQATGMALVSCILGKFLGVVCHCFPPDYMYSSTIFLISALEWSKPRSGRFTPGKKIRFPLHGRLCVDPRASLDRCGKSGPHRDFIPGMSGP